MSMAPRRAGFATGDALLILAGLSLLAALAYPRTERALMRRHAEKAHASVKAVAGAVAAFYKEHASWPPSVGPGEVPPDLIAYLPQGFSFRADIFTLKWDRWQAVEAFPGELSEPPPDEVGGSPSTTPDSSVVVQPPVVAMGAITAQAEDDRILAVLLERFGPSRSFVRAGSWTLVLPPGEGRGGGTP